MNIRLARVEEADLISGLCLRSKAHWGYDAAFMALSTASLTVHRSQIEAGDVWVAEIEGKIAGMVALGPMPDPSLVDLDKLFVEPAAIGSGVGRALMAVAVAEAKRRGYARLAILADTNAADFYQRMGAKYLSHKASDAIPGRTLPYFELML